MRTVRILKISGIVIAALVAVLVAGVQLIDLNIYKEDIRQAVFDATGRELTIDGDIGFSLGLSVGLTVKDVRFANVSWGTESEMLTAREAAIKIAILPLLSGEFDIRGVVIREAVILLESAADGRDNMEIVPRTAPSQTLPPAGTSPAGQTKDTESAGKEFGFRINDVVVENSRLTLRNGAEGFDEVFDLKTFKITRVSQHQLHIDMTSTLVARGGVALPLVVSGDVGTFRTLISGDRPYGLDVSGSFAGFDFTAVGEIGDFQKLTGIAIALELSADDFSGVKALAGSGLPATGPVRFKGSVEGTRDKIALNGIDIQIGKSKLTGNLQATLSGQRPRLDGALEASLLDLVELATPDDAAPTERPSGKTSGKPAGGAQRGAGGDRPGKLFSAKPLPFEALKLVDVTVDIEVTELVVPGATLNGVSAHIVLDDGNLEIVPFDFVLSGGAFDGEILLSSRKPPAKLAFRMAAPRVDMAKVLKEQADVELLRGDASVDIDLVARGNSVAELMANLNGHSRILMEEGETKTRGGALDQLVGGLSSLVAAWWVGDDEWDDLYCLASLFEVEKGTARSKLTVFDTQSALVRLDGQIDLAAETLDLKLTPKSKTTTVNVAVPVRIQGTLAHPTVGPDELAAARRIGGLIGLVIFPPAAVLGLGDIGDDTHPCVQLVKEGESGDTAPMENEPASAPDKAAGEPDMLDRAGDKLLKFFK